MKTVTALDLRKKLGSVLNSVAENHEAVTITRANKPLAVIISPDEYQDKVLKGDQGEEDLRNCPTGWNPGRRSTRKGPAQIDVVKAIRDAQERR